MRILQVIKTNRGAAWAFNQAKHLKEMGVEIITVLPNAHEGNAEKYKENGMAVIEGDWRLPITKPWRFFSVCKHIKQTLKQVQPDIIHLHFVTNVLMCRLALRKDKTPRLFQVPGPLHLESALTSFVERCTATEADYWAGACKKTCSIYTDKGIDSQRVHLAYYGVPHKEASQGISKGILHSEYEISDDAIVVAMVSYFYKPKKYLGQKRGIKGHEDFIDALKVVMQKHPNVVPVIIGNAWDGAETYENQVKEYAKKELGDKIIFTGYRSDIYDIYPEINVVVHPSHSENLGGAAESLMLAVPTISSDVGGFPDIVIPGVTGCLAKSKNPDDLAEKIIWAVENQSELKEMANKGHTLVNDLLDLNNTATKVHEVYSKILNG
jgi:glycosyltransferase involved in cell wall biosynthesis